VKAESGRHEDFERLAMPLFDSLYNFARWLARDETEAEDLVQEAFAKALRGFSSFAPGTDFRQDFGASPPECGRDGHLRLQLF
jgi:RNA polymerase sigma-70 factor (ECF subfamily)